MAKERHSDTPERRRLSYERLAVLALLALGSNFGCSRELLRVPAVSATPPPMPASIPPMAAAADPPLGSKPVALRTVADYGSTLDELFPATYRNPTSYGPQLAGTNTPRTISLEAPGDLESASRKSGIPIPARVDRPAGELPSGVAMAPAYPRQAYGDPLLEACREVRLPPPQARTRASRPRPSPAPLALRNAPPNLVAACETTRIAPPRPPRFLSQTTLPNLEDASKETGISLPMPISAARKPVEPVAGGSVDPDAAFEATRIPPPVPAGPGSLSAPAASGSVFDETRIPPPVPASRQPAEPVRDDTIPPPLPLDPSLFQPSHEPVQTPPQAEPLPQPAAPTAGPDRREAADPAAADAFEATRIAPPTPAAARGRRSQG